MKRCLGSASVLLLAAMLVSCGGGGDGGDGNNGGSTTISTNGPPNTPPPTPTTPPTGGGSTPPPPTVPAPVPATVRVEESDPAGLITQFQPDVLVKGGDWPLDRIIGRAVVEARGGMVRTIPLVPGISTTTLIQKIRTAES